MADDFMTSLIRINGKRMQTLRKNLAPYHYEGTMHLIVFYLRAHPGASQEEIAAFYSLDSDSVLRDARRLDEMGHISREIISDDRRQYRLYLTLQGEAFLKTLDYYQSQFAGQLIEGLSGEDVKTLTHLLAKLESNCCGQD